jgi:glycosyltransferase involved in cell wall biosynthesis
MANILVLSADLPFFPGKMGLDYYNLRYLARHHHVGVVAPCYTSLPLEGVRNLRAAVQECFFWEQAAPAAAEAPVPTALGRARQWPLPTRVRPLALRFRRQLLAANGLVVRSPAELDKLALLANCAPHLLRALASRRWDLLLIIQSDVAPWLDFLPSHLPTVFYLHDLRGAYLERRAAFAEAPRAITREARWAWSCERRIAHDADLLLFVSESERLEAERRLAPRAETATVPIAIDVDYLRAAPPSPHPRGHTVLFTGHLQHPPNVDALTTFLHQVWPELRRRCPTARFVVAGCFPDERLRSACAQAGVELHADVPDIRPFFRQAAVFVVPMRFGGGVRQKILEAWAMEVPVVATTMALDGLGETGPAACVVADQPVHMASAIAAILAAPASVAGQVVHGRQAVGAHDIPTACASFARQVVRAPSLRRARRPRVVVDLRWLRSDTEAEATARATVWALARSGGVELRLLAQGSAFDELRSAVRQPAQHGDRWRFSSRWQQELLGSLGGSPVALERLRCLHDLEADLAHVFLEDGAEVGASDLRLLPYVLQLPYLLPTDQKRQGLAPELCLCPSATTRRALRGAPGWATAAALVAPTWVLDPAGGTENRLERRARTRQSLYLSHSLVLSSGEERRDWTWAPPEHGWRACLKRITQARVAVLDVASPRALMEAGQALRAQVPMVWVGAPLLPELEGICVVQAARDVPAAAREAAALVADIRRCDALVAAAEERRRSLERQAHHVLAIAYRDLWGPASQPAPT